MNKIRFPINKEANFVFHMLSVAKCGYDNAHGEKYRHLYSTEDLPVLKQYESLLTVHGGEHCGALYWYLVSQPACGMMTALQYYHMFPESSYMEFLTDHTDAIQNICAVMIRSYPIFETYVWPESKPAIEQYIRPLADRFDHSGFTESAERTVGIQLDTPVFNAVMTDSMENGAEAIDIALDQDVFCICRPYDQAFAFVAHEYIIYLLKSALKDTSAFKNMHTWPITEALAEYYLQKILGKTGMFRNQSRWIEYYEMLKSANPHMTPQALYLAAEEELNQPTV